jgi:hypothetical protein
MLPLALVGAEGWLDVQLAIPNEKAMTTAKTTRGLMAKPYARHRVSNGSGANR